MPIDRSSLKLDFEKFNDENIRRVLSYFGRPETVRVLYLSTYLPRYTRTEAMLGLLKRNRIQHASVLTDGSILKYPAALYRLVKLGDKFDVVFVAFRGHEILPFIRLLTSKPIIFDAFVSMYDTLCYDRQVFSPGSVFGRMIRSYEKFLLNISDTVLVDTISHKKYFEETFGAGNIDCIYSECDTGLFSPSVENRKSGAFTVFWHGSCRPLHGVDVILKAAKILEQDAAIRFRLVGPVLRTQRGLLKTLGLKNVDLADYIDYNKLPDEINKADICLGGHFSDKDKAKRVIAGKTFQYLACGKPVILGDNTANRELFIESGAARFVAMDSPQALAKTIKDFRDRTF
jgi:glycosyltransferase involved in cell wall biosynthesis